MNILHNIPSELTKLQQWVCFDITDEKKIPFIPGTNSMASSNRSRDWRSFRAACADVESGKRQHIGFCFTKDDPYVFIDLDDPDDDDQRRIFERFDTYAQRSVSGEGCHIICRGTFQGSGKHPKFPHAGLFKQDRFCLMTGDVVEGHEEIKEVPEEDLQAVHTWLGGSPGESESVSADLVEYEAEIPDMTVIEMGIDRFHKFDALCSGRWEQFEEYRNDHSTADHAFIAMLCDLTESNEQVRYLFKISGMWNQERADKKAGHGPNGYIDRTIRKVRAEQERAKNMLAKYTLHFPREADEKPPLPEIEVSEPDANLTDHGLALIERLPKGLIRDIARYSYRTSFYPLPEASIAGSLAFHSAVVGRHFLTPTNSGLNLWIIVVGGTSCGKDEYQKLINRLTNSLHKRNVHSISRLTGGEFTSGPAVEQVFSDRKRYLSYSPEFGDLFKTICNPHAPDYVRNLYRQYLNSYNAADKHGSIKARRKAQGVESGVEVIERPCLVLAGEATPEALYGAMTARELSTGFLQRFILMDVAETSWSSVENEKHASPPPRSLMDRIEDLVIRMDGFDVDNLKVNHSVVSGEPEALELLAQYRKAKRVEIMNSPDGLARKEVINRAGLKALRVASSFAVSADSYTPVITMEHAECAINMIDHYDSRMLEKFTTGEIGSGQVKQEAEILRVARSFTRMPKAQRKSAGMCRKVAAEPMLLPLSILKSAVVNSGAFSSDRQGAVTAFEKSVEALVRSGQLVKVERNTAEERYGFTRGTLLCVFEK